MTKQRSWTVEPPPGRLPSPILPAEVQGVVPAHPGWCFHWREVCSVVESEDDGQTFLFNSAVQWCDGIAPVLAWGFTLANNGCVLVLANGHPVWVEPFCTVPTGRVCRFRDPYWGQGTIESVTVAVRGPRSGGWWADLTYNPEDYVPQWT